MHRVMLNVDDSIFRKVVSLLQSFPEGKIKIFDDISYRNETKKLELDFIDAFKKIKEIESGKKVAKTWQEIRNYL